MTEGQEWLSAAEDFIDDLNEMLRGKRTVNIICDGTVVRWDPCTHTLEMLGDATSSDCLAMFHHDCRTPQFVVDGTWCICAMVSKGCGISMSMLSSIYADDRERCLRWNPVEYEEPEFGFETEVE